MGVLQGNCGVPQDKKRAWQRLLAQVPAGMQPPVGLALEVWHCHAGCRLRSQGILWGCQRLLLPVLLV